MPRHDKQEKAKDLKGTLIRIFKSLGEWKIILVISCILALFAAILSTVAPNKLADVTNVISDGIKPDVENMKKVSEGIYKNAIQTYVIYKYRNPQEGTTPPRYNLEDEETIKTFVEEFNNLTPQEKNYLLEDIEIDGTKISVEDQIKYMDLISTIDQNAVSEDYIAVLDKLPNSIKKLIWLYILKISAFRTKIKYLEKTGIKYFF